MHWYFQLSSLVFIPSPALPSSLFMPHNRHLGLQLRVSGSVCPWAKSFISYMGKKRWELRRVFMRLSGERWASSPGDGGELLWILGEFSVEVLWSSCGSPPNFTWRSCKFPVEVLWNACASLSCLRLLWPPALVCTSIFMAFPECDANLVLILVNLQMFWCFEIGAALIDPPNYQLWRRILCPGLFLLQSHSPPRSTFRPKFLILSRLCFCLFFFPPYLMNCQLFMQIRVEEIFKGYL